jgi:hypothetical protein
MACTYDINLSSDGCFVEIVEQPSGKIVHNLHLVFLIWLNKGDDDITIADQRYNFTADIDNINGYATVALLIADLQTWRDACQLPTSGGGPAIPPTTVNGTVVHDVFSAPGSTLAGLHGVTITNTGGAAGTVGGKPIAPGENISISCYYDEVTKQMRMLPAIAYDGTGTTLSITTFV